VCADLTAFYLAFILLELHLGKMLTVPVQLRQVGLVLQLVNFLGK
jgi:hypothetical protein